MAFVVIPDGDIDQDSPITVALMTAYRDNLLAVVNGDTGAPILGLTLLAATIVGGAVASVDFTAGFNATRYESYLFSWQSVVGVSNSFLACRTSTDGGASYDAGATNYAQDVVSSGVGSQTTSTLITLAATIFAANLDDGSCGTLELFAPDVATSNTQLSSKSTSLTSPTVATNVDVSAARLSNANVDGFRFLMGVGNIAQGTFTMYGRGRV